MRIPLVGGDPDLVRSLVDLLSELRSAVDEQYRPVDRGVGMLLSGWSGTAAEAFFDRMQDQRPQVDAIDQDTTTINDALNRFAEDLEAIASAAAEVQHRLEQLDVVREFLVSQVSRPHAWLLNDEARQVLAMLDSVRVDAYEARMRLEEELGSLAFFGEHGPDGMNGYLIRADERSDWGGRFRGEVDWAGELIGRHWVLGQGQHLVIHNDPAWSDYMTENITILRNAGDWIAQEARNAIAALPAGGDRPVAIAGPLDLDENGYGTGYELLHSANVRERGGFEVTGTQTVTPLPDGGHEVHVVADYTWHDRQDPNPVYDEDPEKADDIRSWTLDRPVDYNLDITWTREAVLRFDANGVLDHTASYGWPINPLALARAKDPATATEGPPPRSGG